MRYENVAAQSGGAPSGYAGENICVWRWSKSRDPVADEPSLARLTFRLLALLLLRELLVVVENVFG